MFHTFYGCIFSAIDVLLMYQYTIKRPVKPMYRWTLVLQVFFTDVSIYSSTGFVTPSLAAKCNCLPLFHYGVDIEYRFWGERTCACAVLVTGARIHGNDVAFFFLLLHYDSGKINPESSHQCTLYIVFLWSRTIVTVA